MRGADVEEVVEGLCREAAGCFAVADEAGFRGGDLAAVVEVDELGRTTWLRAWRRGGGGGGGGGSHGQRVTAGSVEWDELGGIDQVS